MHIKNIIFIFATRNKKVMGYILLLFGMGIMVDSTINIINSFYYYKLSMYMCGLFGAICNAFAAMTFYVEDSTFPFIISVLLTLWGIFLMIKAFK